jgi:hypothetical protein
MEVIVGGMGVFAGVGGAGVDAGLQAEMTRKTRQILEIIEKGFIRFYSSLGL